MRRGFFRPTAAARAGGAVSLRKYLSTHRRRQRLRVAEMKMPRSLAPGTRAVGAPLTPQWLQLLVAHRAVLVAVSFKGNDVTSLRDAQPQLPSRFWPGSSSK
jgi:hypothetical protein